LELEYFRKNETIINILHTYFDRRQKLMPRTKKDASRLEAAEMKLPQGITKSTRWYKIQNQHIRQDLKAGAQENMFTLRIQWCECYTCTAIGFPSDIK
jgi:hypothetical protein